jgi:catechol 2,3-dioxygenase-like lactoylglutathione lyase family enzyme
MLDHIGFPVSNLAHSRAFYTAALAPLGIHLLFEIAPETSGGAAFAGFGAVKPRFWIGTGEALKGQLHVAFAAKDRAAVHAFYEAALAAGGRDNGKPGLRPIYHQSYYAAFIVDPDGHRIEAVCHQPE